MAGIYPQTSSHGAIGSLLRLIQEQKSQTPIIPPQAEVSSPIRSIVQQPLEGPESPGTARVVSVKPEAVQEMGIESAPEGVPARSSIGPTAIGGWDATGVIAASSPPEPQTTNSGLPSVDTQTQSQSGVFEPSAQLKTEKPTPPSALFQPPSVSYVPSYDFSPPKTQRLPDVQRHEKNEKRTVNVADLDRQMSVFYPSITKQELDTLGPLAKEHMVAVAKSKQLAKSPTPSPTPIGTVLGASTPAPKKQEQPWHRQSPIQFLATKIFRKR